MKTWKADLALFGNTVIWGATFVLVKEALREVSPLLYLALRFGLATLALFPLLIAGARRGKLNRRSLLSGAAVGALLFLGYFFQTTGLQYTTPAKSAFFTSLSIPMVPIMAALLYRKAPRKMELAGVAVASVGMVLLTTEGSRIVWDLGSLLSCLCAVAFAAHIVALGWAGEWASFEVIAFTQVVTTAALAGATAPFLETPRLRWTRAVVVAIVVTGLLATALAFTVQSWAQQHTTPTRTALIYTLEPVWAWVTSWLVAREKLSGLGILGGALILSGVLLVEWARAEAGEPIPAAAPEA